MIFDLNHSPSDSFEIVDPSDATRRKVFSPSSTFEDLLKPVVRNGAVIRRDTHVESSRRRRAEDISYLHPTIQRFLNPHSYPVGLETNLFELKNKMVGEIRSRQRGLQG